MQQTRQRDSALNHSPRIRVHLLSRPSESLHIVQFYEKDEFLGDEGFERITLKTRRASCSRKSVAISLLGSWKRWEPKWKRCSTS